MRLAVFLKHLSKDWLTKAVSVMLAVFLWYFVVGEDQVDTNIHVPVEILNLPSDLVISNQYKKEIDVSVRGPRSLILDLRNRNITMPVDLSNKKPGTIVVKNTPGSIPFPSGITVLRVQPANITLILDRLISKQLPIEPVTEGEPAPGYVLKKITMEPDFLIVPGPKTILDSVTDLKTYIIDINGLDHSMTLQIHLSLRPELKDIIGETVVNAGLEVEENFIESKVEDIPVNVRETDLQVITRPGKISVTARISENLIMETPEPAMLFRASVSAKDVKEPRMLPVTVNGVNVPGHKPIQILSVKPTEVLVTPTDSPPKPESVQP